MTEPKLCKDCRWAINTNGMIIDFAVFMVAICIVFFFAMQLWPP
jgi:hypothetical protein